MTIQNTLGTLKESYKFAYECLFYLGFRYLYVICCKDKNGF
uniref:Uncharacterized protein n=1 Tax=Glaesserella parasuis TaxID=738 RepID=A0A6B9L7Q5_GLAPU|nr:hypothetical protein [Glaesserella parasuis]QOW02371.1 hypothetical protein [Glaesserella parasuis]QOX05681.1 hypothetical protein [Glaesserella parasuis]QOX05770.1 hypothetical protein [Glaesserella parasuis]QOX05846.1 hypothetical protein [Glaesserella parasuis]